MPAHDPHDLIKTLGWIVLVVSCVFGVKAFKYVDSRHPNYWPERRGPFLPAIDLLNNIYLFVIFLIRLDYKAFNDPVLDKLAHRARFGLIASLIVLVVAALD